MQKKSIMKTYNVHLPFLIVLLLSGTLVDVFVRYVSGSLFDRLSKGTYKKELITMLFLFIVEIFVSYYKKLQAERFFGGVQCSFFSKIEAAVFQLGQQREQEVQKGQLLNTFENDVNIVCSYLRRIYERFAVAILQYVFSLALLFWIHPSLSIVAIVFSGIIFFVMKLGAGSLGNAYAAYQQQKDALLKMESDGVFNLELVKVSNMQQDICKKHESEIEKTNMTQAAPAKLEAFLGVPSMMTAFLVRISLLGAAGFLRMKNVITSGELIMVITLVEYIVNLPMMIDGVVSAYKQADISYKRILEIIDTDVETVCIADMEEREAIQSITLQDLSFGYTEFQVLQHINLTFQKGAINVVRGANGKGKSTIMKLLKQVYDHYEGNILLNERNLRHISNDELNERIAVCPQEVYLYETSIRENLTLGKETPMEMVVSACRNVGIWDEIQALEHGLDTVLYQNGQPLSIGQRQRIMLARTLLCQADVMIFDEPTSSFKVGGKDEFLEVLQKLAVDHIVIVISHDASLFANCDINEVCL